MRSALLSEELAFGGGPLGGVIGRAGIGTGSRGIPPSIVMPAFGEACLGGVIGLVGKLISSTKSGARLGRIGGVGGFGLPLGSVPEASAVEDVDLIQGGGCEGCWGLSCLPPSNLGGGGAAGALGTGAYPPLAAAFAFTSRAT